MSINGDFVERSCANPNCRNVLNAELVPKKVRYCSQCQLILRDFRFDFPRAPMNDLKCLLLNSEINLSQAARILGWGVSTVRYYTKSNFVLSRKDCQRRMLAEQALYILRDKSKSFFTAIQVSRETGIGKDRIIYLMRIGAIPHTHNRFGLNVFTRSMFSKIISQDKVYRQAENKRRSKSVFSGRVKPTQGEMTIKQIARKLGVSTVTVTSRITVETHKNGQLKATQRNRTYYIKPSDFEDFCRRLICQKNVKGHLKNGAQRYLDSIAAG